MRAVVVAPLGALVFSLALAGCGGPVENADGGADAAALDAGHCAADADCDDGLFCNGTERCSANRCVPGQRVACDDAIDCTIDRCDESARSCRNRAPDADGDGHADAHCVDHTGTPLGDDCDETDPNRYPGNTPERCDTAGHDEDCDPTTHGGRDLDGDGHEDHACCNGAMCGDDCDDARASVQPGATEVCNAIDDDCDAMIDEGVSIAGFVDADRDGFGDPSMPRTSCHAAVGFSVDGTDCDDTRADVRPGMPELCDGIDNDCDAATAIDANVTTVSWYADADGDGFGTEASSRLACSRPAGYALLAGDCDDANPARSPGTPERCNALDDDCNDVADYAIAPGDTEDDDLDGVADAACGAPAGRDCDDRDASSAPGEPETCDGRDNDCDTRIDENTLETVFYRDGDGDGWGANGATRLGCSVPTGFVAHGGDCDDANPEQSPGSPEACNGSDDDCDGAVDEGSANGCGLPNALAACVNARCAVVGCATGWGDCTSATGCETSLASDGANCGRCGATCSAGSYCVSGTCRGAPFDTTGLVAWLDANDVTNVGDGQPLTSWRNRADGVDFVPFDTAPTARLTSSFGAGLRSVTFAAGGMRSTSNIFDTRFHTIFVVARPTDGHEDDLVGTDLYVGPAGEVLLMFLGNSLVGHHWTNGGLDQSYGGSVVSGHPYVATMIDNGTTLDGWLNGTRVSSVAYPGGGPSSSLQPVLLGSRCSGCYPPGEYQGEMGEVIVFARTLSLAERASVEAYLRGRWGF